MKNLISTAVQSKHLNVFPCVSRTYTDTGTGENKILRAKLLSEKNITNIIKSLADNPSFIISYEGGTIKFILEGYYFEIEEFSLVGNKYVCLNMNGELLHGDTSEDEFGGLEIYDIIPPNKVYLTLCENGKIPSLSYQKFTGVAFGKTIDCGLLN